MPVTWHVTNPNAKTDVKMTRAELEQLSREITKARRDMRDKHKTVVNLLNTKLQEEQTLRRLSQLSSDDKRAVYQALQAEGIPSDEGF